MISLLKIRYMHLRRHKLLFCIYLVLPIFALIGSFFVFISISFSNYKGSIPKNFKFSNYLYKNDKYSFQNFDLNYLENAAILTDIEENGKKLSQFIKEETKINIDYYIEEDELNKKNYTYIIIYNQKNGKNEFQLKIINKLNNSIFDYKANYRFLLAKFNSRINGTKEKFESLINKFMPNQKKDYFPNVIILMKQSEIFELCSTLFGVYLSLEMTFFCYYFSERMVEEKEKKLHDFLERQGISKKKYIMSWFITYSYLSIFPFISFLILGGIVFTNFFLFGLIGLILYMFSIFSVIYFLSTSISSLKKGSIIIKIYCSVSSVVGCALSITINNNPSRITKILLFLFPQINIYNTTSLMFLSRGNGNYKDMIYTQLKGITYLESTIFYVVEIIFFTLISLFIQSYKRSGLDFCLFLKSFCTKVSRKIELENQPLIDEENGLENLVKYETHYEELSLINKQNKNENKCLKVVGVSKKYNDLKAVDNFNCEFFSNEIFCLLGHNGAGKTTLVNMISGLIDPEEGDIFLYGNSLVINKDLIYQNIGLCQQQDIFFDYLNVNEHLQYIYDIKGIPKDFNEIQELIIKLDLSNAQNRICKELSGGEKRKLCIALALLSGGKIIILDEPTSGMDVIAKKQLWEFLRSYQKDKIIIITTHSLEEAEFLGNRIGIMSDGRLICYGTSPFLKSKYPCGININLILNAKLFNENYKKIIYEKIKEYDPHAEIKVASKGVFSINIQEDNDHIYDIFKYVEDCKNQYGIEDYNVGSASLEDVFLKINNKSNIKDMKYVKQNIEQNVLIPELRHHSSSFCPQLRMQLYRNLLPIYRNASLFFLELIGSLVCCYIFMPFFIRVTDINNKAKNDTISLLSLTFLIGFIIYLGGFSYDKIKERNTKTKYLLYLSGCNIWSYWCGFLVIDFMKLILYSALSLIPMYLILKDNYYLYLFLSMPMLCLSSLVFMYFFSLFVRNEDSGTKILLLSIILTFISIGTIYGIISTIFINTKFARSIINFSNKIFYFTLYDLNPLTSFGLTISRIANSCYFRKDKERIISNGYFKPYWYVINGNIMQLINFILYFTLLVLHETGAFKRCCIKKPSKSNDFAFSEESVDDDFYAYNNLRNPLIYDQNMNNNNNNKNFVNNNNQVVNNANNNIINNNFENEEQINNNIYSINDPNSQSQKPIEIDINSENNANNINNNNNLIFQNQVNTNQNNTNNDLYNQNYNMNPFVQAEINKIRTNPNLSTKIEGLYKTFFNCCKKNVRVVNNLFLGLEPNEKFGLLGFNGSGKTTTFRAITNEIAYESGSITLFGHNGKTEFDKLRSIVGYCPQENPLFDYMKVKEIIQFYLKLKRSNETIESICSTFNLSKYLDTYCVNLSGGNKRKLAFAIALMNKPRLLLLDEPSTGVDPESRRVMWKNINDLTNTGHQYNMILTTHSIEEAEILCDRVSWLKKGNFVCIGNPEQLKLRYSNGYKLHIKFINTIINKEDASKLTRQMVQDEYNAIIKLVQDFNKYSKYISSNPIMALYIRALVRIAGEIKPNTYKLRLLQMEKDFSFMLEVGVLKEKQKILFSQIFNMKKKNPQIAEISINLEALGNILTYFK